MTEPTLDEIGRKNGSDKSSCGSEPWQWSMNYLSTSYEPVLESLRDQPITLLELGWGEWDPVRKDHANPENGGRSARTWSEYFTHPGTRIVVIDVEEKHNTINDPRVQLHRGSQDDPEFLSSLHERYGDFNIIIDDASHISSLTIKSFEILWPWLKPQGHYFVEDLFTSTHPWFWGENEANENPAAPCSTGAPTAMQYFLRLTNDLNFRGEWAHGPELDGSRTEWDAFPRKYWLGHKLESVTFRRNICVIKKAG